MSGYTDNVAVQPGALDPGIILLQKPFTRNRLLSVVRETIDAQSAKSAGTFRKAEPPPRSRVLTPRRVPVAVLLHQH